MVADEDLVLLSRVSWKPTLETLLSAHWVVGKRPLESCQTPAVDLSPHYRGPRRFSRLMHRRRLHSYLQ